MGIIAGIAIPTTIAVINRQRNNAAVRTADNMFDAAKEVLMEAVAGSAITGTVAYDTTGFAITVEQMVTNGDLEKNPIQGTNSTTVAFAISSANKFYIGTITSGSFAAAQTTMQLNNKSVVGTNGTDGGITFALA